MRSAGVGWAAGLGALALLVTLVTPSGAVTGRDFAITGGHYYEQGGPVVGQGFIVSNDDAAPFWGELRRLGGTQALGYPLSQRYACDGALCQVFQHGVFRWAPGASEVELLNVFDMLHVLGKDAWLEEHWGVPPWPPVAPPPAAPSSKKQKRQTVPTGVPRVPDDAPQDAMIGASGAVQAAYDQLGERSSRIYGLARAYRVTDEQAVLRTQRAVFIQSASAPGQVQSLPAGAVFIEGGLVPAEALEPVAAPEPSDSTPPIRISMPDLSIDATVIPMDMGADHLLPVPDNGRVVAWYSYGARLGEEGNAIFAGHVDWNGQVGVFWRLRDARPGQIITLSSSAGRAYDYRVEWTRSYPEESSAGLAALRQAEGVTSITLVTCGGRFDAQSRSYQDRQVVRAILVDERTPETAS